MAAHYADDWICPNPKRTKTGSREVMADNCDRISQLSDDILIHILSFLHYKDDIGPTTSLLSKRWRYLWRDLRSQLPVIRFKTREGRRTSVHDLDASVVDDFISKTSTLEALDIEHSSYPPSKAYMNVVAHWIQMASVKSVRILALCGMRGVDIPESVFSCQMLRELRLEGFVIRSIPTSFRGFNCLKNLHLVCHSISCEALNLLLSKCPLLESLAFSTLQVIRDYNPVSLKLSSRSLRHVSLHSRGFSEIGINAPNIRSIHYRGELSNLIMQITPCLLQAKIRCLDWVCCDVMKLDFLSIVEKLWVDHLFFQAFPYIYLNKKAFKNLKELHFDSMQLTHELLGALVSIIGNSPTLNTLHVNLSWGCSNHRGRPGNKPNIYKAVQSMSADYHVRYTDDTERRNCDPTRQPNIYKVAQSMNADYYLRCTDDTERRNCDSTRQLLKFSDSPHYLQKVFLNEFLGTPNELRLVEYLLRNGDALEELIILDFLDRDKKEICQILACIPRASLIVQMSSCPNE